MSSSIKGYSHQKPSYSADMRGHLCSCKVLSKFLFNNLGFIHKMLCIFSLLVLSYIYTCEMCSQFLELYQLCSQHSYIVKCIHNCSHAFIIVHMYSHVPIEEGVDNGEELLDAWHDLLPAAPIPTIISSSSCLLHPAETKLYDWALFYVRAGATVMKGWVSVRGIYTVYWCYQRQSTQFQWIELVKLARVTRNMIQTGLPD